MCDSFALYIKFKVKFVLFFFLRNELFDDVCEKMEETRREALREMDEAKEKEKKGGKVTAWNDKERIKSWD